LEFKAGPGSDINQKLKDNAEISKEKKKQLKSAANLVNQAKQDIDDLKVMWIVLRWPQFALFFY